ncbi:MAG: hypothetical protein WD055_04140 [Candidatus Dependentiae bacterium]
MNFKKIQKITLFVVLIGVSMPAQAFWGQETLSRWTANVISYVQDLYGQPADHKTALTVGGTTAAVIAAVLAYNYWPKKDEESAVPAIIARRASVTSPAIQPALLDEPVSDSDSETEEESFQDTGVGAFTPKEEEFLQGQVDEIPAAAQPGTRRVSAQIPVPAAAEVKVEDVQEAINIDALKAQVAQYSFTQEQQESVVVGAYVQYVLTHQAEWQSVVERLNQSPNRKIFVRDLIWYWDALARMRNQRFTEGTYQIFDPSGNVFDFIKNTPGAYSRISSHFTAYSTYNKMKKEHYGLNIDGLPNGMTTLLFGTLTSDKQRFFVKPESHGIEDVTQAAAHGVSFAQAQARKFADVRLPQGLRSTAEYYVGGYDDQSNWRKERIPSVITQKFNALVKRYVCDDLAKQEDLIKQGAAFGISRIAQLIHDNTLFFDQADKDVTALQSMLYGYDNLTLRFGREIIIDTSDNAEKRAQINNRIAELLQQKRAQDTNSLRWLFARGSEADLNNALSHSWFSNLKDASAFKNLFDNVQDAQQVFKYLYEHKLL